jgi:phosphoglycolate phosphatase-like HAD superfamily hydrolase
LPTMVSFSVFNHDHCIYTLCHCYSNPDNIQKDKDMLPYQCWCFDFDGTLIDIRSRFANIYRDLVMKMGGQPITGYIKKRYSGKTEKEIFLLSGLPEHLYDEYDTLREIMLEDPYYLSYDRLFDGVSLLLKYLRENDGVIWIITHRSNENNLLNELESLDLMDLIDSYVCTRDMLNTGFQISPLNWKECAVIQKTHELLKLTQRYSKIVMIGDSPTDIKAAHDATVSSIALPTGLFNPHELMSAEPDFLFADIVQLSRELVLKNIC